MADVGEQGVDMAQPCGNMDVEQPCADSGVDVLDSEEEQSCEAVKLFEAELAELMKLTAGTPKFPDPDEPEYLGACMSAAADTKPVLPAEQWKLCEKRAKTKTQKCAKKPQVMKKPAGNSVVATTPAPDPLRQQAIGKVNKKLLKAARQRWRRARAEAIAAAGPKEDPDVWTTCPENMKAMPKSALPQHGKKAGLFSYTIHQEGAQSAITVLAREGAFFVVSCPPDHPKLKRHGQKDLTINKKGACNVNWIKNGGVEAAWALACALAGWK